MCSVGDDGIEDETAVKYMEEKLSIKEKTCNKCKEREAIVLLRAKDCYCKECFLSGTFHKFRAFLGKQRISKMNEHVLVSYKTGHPSSMLLQFLKDGLGAPTPKQMKFTPVIIYIEQNFHLTLNERKDVLNRISNHVKLFNFKVYFVSFAEYFIDDKLTIVEDCDKLRLRDDDFDKISKKLTNRIKLTYQKEIFDVYGRELLVKCAESLQCTYIITTDLTSDVAVRLLTNVSLGRGNQLPLDIGVCDDRNLSVKIIRPMRNLIMKECALYNYFNNIEPVVMKEVKEKVYGSVQGLMRNFIDKLQVNYPATITTVLRTGDKLSMDKKNISSECSMCKAPIYPKSDKLTSAEATQFSRHLSTTKLNMEKSPVQRYEEALSTFVESQPEYCIACSTVSQYLIKD